MTLEDFIAEYSGAAFDEADMALTCLSELDETSDLALAAQRFVDARDDFLSELSAAGVELG